MVIRLTSSLRNDDGRTEVRCTDCGYRAVVAFLPARCPMCGGAAWAGPGHLSIQRPEEAA